MNEKRNTVIESLGVYLPPKEVSSKEILLACKNALRYPLERLTGIKNRRMAGEVEFAIDLARKAVQTCLERSKYTADEVELLICCNISRYDGPNFQFSFEPSTSVRLRAQLGMPNALCFDISNACAGMFTGTYIANAFLKSGLVQNAMVVSGEYITHLTRTAQFEISNERDERLACLTLGDSGAAAIMELGDNDQVGFHDIDMYTLGAYSDCCIAKPTTSEAGGAIMLTDSLRIHAVAIGESVKHVISVLRKLKWSKKDLKHFIMHQTARSAISELSRQVNELYKEKLLDTSNMVYNVAERGNTSSTTHFVAIWDNIRNGKIQNGDSLVFAVQASGITLGTAPYTFDDLPERLREFETRGTRPANVEVITDSKTEIDRQRVRLESLGTISKEERALVPRNAIALASSAAVECLKHSKHQRDDIDLLIHAGVHRDEFLSEPALAALIAGAVKINAEVEAIAEHKTFAYDIINGAVSFLNGCYNGVAMINSGKARNVMVVASEIENNLEFEKYEKLNLLETGSAAILDASPDSRGFSAFHFSYFTDFVNTYYSFIGQEKGQSYLDITRDEKLEEFYLDCIPKAVRTFLAREGVNPPELQAVFPPMISEEFVARLAERMQLGDEQIVSVANGKDYFTSSSVYGLQEALATDRVKAGDRGLLINVGTGIQVGCALYEF